MASLESNSLWAQAASLVAAHEKLEEARRQLDQAEVKYRECEHAYNRMAEILAKCVGANIRERLFMVGTMAVDVTYVDGTATAPASGRVRIRFIHPQ